jgi:hypothetical protein
MTPSTTISKTDGNLGVSSATERILAIIGTSSAGDYDTPTSVTSKNDLTDEFGNGPLVEACAYMIARGIPVVAVRANPATDGDYGSITDGVTGTATVAETASTFPTGNYDVIVEILTGGALGTAGITYRYSFDNGVGWSDETALGTSLIFALGRGVSFTLSSATSTLIAGDTWSVTTTGPVIGTGDLTDSFAALKLSSLEWLRVLVLATADATIIAQCESFATSFHADGKYPEVITNTRFRGSSDPDETRAEYQAAMAAIAIAGQTRETSVGVDQCELVSEVSGNRFRQPISIPYAARLMLIDDSQDAAAKSDGALPGVFLTTDSGDGKYHDERKHPGLDALGFTTLRTWGGRPITPGVYINNPRVISGAGSDYRYFQHSALINRVIEMTFQLFNNRLSKSVLVDSTTGKIRESSARALEEAVTADLRTAFEDSKRCSAVRCVVSRTDDILVTDTIHFDVQVVPLGVVKKFIGKAGLVRSLPA